MTIFGKSLPLEVSSRVWDNFLLDGEVFLYRTGLAILKKNESTLLKASFEECIMMLHEVSKSAPESIEFLFYLLYFIFLPYLEPRLIILTNAFSRKMYLTLRSCSASSKQYQYPHTFMPTSERWK
jgi:hypothetical protein